MIPKCFRMELITTFKHHASISTYTGQARPETEEPEEAAEEEEVAEEEMASVRVSEREFNFVDYVKR